LGEYKANIYKLDSTQLTSDEIDVEAFRARLRKMTDEELIRQGKAGRYMCSPQANLGKPPRRCFVIQFEEVKAEWRRRHPKHPPERYEGERNE